MSKTGHPPRRDRRVVASALAVALAAGGVYLARGSDDPDARTHGALAVGEFPEPGVVHVHGLGVDPQDGTLYAATHSGLFRIPARGRASRVANRYQDTMGFTVIGPRTFLGSGHPDLREDVPVRLGLIESTDAGETWTPLSLQGQADFHALHAAHGNVYGYDSTSGSFMVSRDRRVWDTRSAQPMRDFVVSPSSPDTIVATTDRGVLRSADGGRSWQPLPRTPVLVVLAWQRTTSLYGVTPDGTVLLSTDGGVRWTARGRVNGEPAAMTVDARGSVETVYVAVAGRGILASTDGGKTFNSRYSE
ncbi:MAG TPA: exo-alpha-sialidase [Mycobacteriales bacterium]|nr:exo-alpha-sialidase [Mycobacteriales bacterium]